MDNLISRQAAINAVDAIRHIASITMSDGDKCIRKSAAKYVLSILPSAQPDIVRCDDCKHWINGHLCESLSRFGSFETKADFYCGYAKRKTDEEVN